MKVLEANFDALKKYRPNMMEKIENMDIPKSFDWRIEYAKDGSIIDVYHSMLNNKDIYLQSRYNPIKEAEHFSRNYEDSKPESCFLYLGMGNGYVIRELLKYNINTILFYEPSIEYFFHVLSNYDISDILAEKRVVLYVDKINSDLLEIELFYYVNNLNCFFFFLESMPKYNQLYADEYKYLMNVYNKSKKHAQMLNCTVVKAAKNQYINAISNLYHFYKANNLADYGEMLSDIPVIIVATGPSLEKNIEYLKECYGRAYVLAVDRSSKILTDKHITPDAYVTVDEEMPIVYIAKDSMQANIPWFVYSTSSREILDNVKGDIIFSSTINGYYSYLSKLVESELNQIENGGHVASVAMSIAKILGSRVIIFLGQDLAYNGNKTHAGEEEKDIDTDGLIEINGFYGDKAYTSNDFKFYLDWYEAYIKQNKDIKFVNATEGGAYIQGMEHISFQDAIRKYCGFEKEAFIHEKKQRNESYKDLLLKEYDKLEAYMEMITEEVETVILWTERGIDILNKSGYMDPELDKIEREMDCFQHKFLSYEGSELIDLYAGKEKQDAMMDINFAMEDKTDELIRLYDKLLCYYKAIKEAVEIGIPILRERIAMLKKDYS